MKLIRQQRDKSSRCVPVCRVNKTISELHAAPFHGRLWSALSVHRNSVVSARPFESVCGAHWFWYRLAHVRHVERCISRRDLCTFRLIAWFCDCLIYFFFAGKNIYGRRIFFFNSHNFSSLTIFSTLTLFFVYAVDWLPILVGFFLMDYFLVVSGGYLVIKWQCHLFFPFNFVLNPLKFRFEIASFWIKSTRKVCFCWSWVCCDN